MGRKIFVSYKYADSQVQDLNLYEMVEFLGSKWPQKIITTARHYVDKLAEKLEEGDHIYKGEDDGESMESLADSTIGSKLGDKIFDSSITIVLISKGMKNPYLREKDQWIPWEISYSLKEQSRDSGRSKTNAVLAVVLPDTIGSYDYFIENRRCQDCTCRILHTPVLFQILRDNMFNIKSPNCKDCNISSSKIYYGYSSYIHSVKWSDFIGNIDNHIDIALQIRQNIDQYELTKSVK